MSDGTINIIVKQDNKTIDITHKKEDSLYTTLCNHNIFIDAVCAGSGVCGKCKVRILSGYFPISQQDKIFLSEQELEEGYRLACQAYPTDDCVIWVNVKNEYQVESHNNPFHVEKKYSDCGIIIDIGTTTIIYKLIDRNTGMELKSESQLNNNRMYGADVLRRIETANSGSLQQMCQQLRKQISDGIMKLSDEDELRSVTHIIISANMTMIHILMKYSCENLGKFPFTSVTTDWIRTDTAKLELLKEKIPLTIMPAISTFVGGDIVSGLFSLNIIPKNKKTFFIDLGTNAEMVLTDGKGGVFVSSASAGPAFEGGNISCGIGSVNGAIQGVKIFKGTPNLDVIGGQSPIGICGSGIIEILYELRKNNIIDETGLLIDEYFDSGYSLFKDEEREITITQKDIREIQMAKAAIAAGIDILLQETECQADEIEDIYLAGGFGYHLSIKKAIGIGLLKKEWDNRVSLVGNTSIMGAKKYLCNEDIADEIDKIKTRSKEIYLSNLTGFQESYLQNMSLADIAEND